MQKSESISNLTKALVKAQAQMGAAIKGNKNPFFKSNYSDLPTVMEVVKGPLNENGLLVLQPSAHRDGKNFIDTVIIHGESGEYISSETEVICAKANDAQNFGAGQTYARRFGLQSMLFIPSEDDDGNHASGRATTKPSYTAPVQQAPAPSVATPAAQAPVTVATPAVLATAVEPLKKSSFRKTPAAPAAVVAAAPASTDEEWS